MVDKSFLIQPASELPRVTKDAITAATTTHLLLRALPIPMPINAAISAGMGLAVVVKNLVN